MTAKKPVGLHVVSNQVCDWKKRKKNELFMWELFYDTISRCENYFMKPFPDVLADKLAN